MRSHENTDFSIPLEVRKGRRLYKEFQVFDSDNLPKNITGWKVFTQIRKSSSAPVLAEMATAERVSSSGAGRASIVSGSDGIFAISLPSSVTGDADLVAGRYYYDTILEDGSGNKCDGPFGTFTLLPNLTRES